MFTGIIEELGHTVEVTDLGTAARLVVAGSPALVAQARSGDSYAVNGVCLTLTGWTPAGELIWMSFDVMAESLAKSALGSLRSGDPVNVERPVQLQGRLGGHLVQGHVDAVGEVLARRPDEHWELVTVSLPADIARYVVVKGSITVDGVSLTVVEIGDGYFSVSLIPETLTRTTLGSKQPGAAVNLEVDIIGKYVERLLGERT